MTGDAAGTRGELQNVTAFPARDARIDPRYPTSMPATILPSFHDRIPCVIRDLSDGGARIGLSPRYALPGRFWIVVWHVEITRRARLVWRRGAFAGIAFERPLGRRSRLR